jgi:UDP-GlcNAc:undecaprenyl-phosphate GlcNAc-1-phosphate transferase
MQFLIEHFKSIFLTQANSQPLAFVIAFTVTYVLTPLVRQRALEMKLPERKQEHHLSHKDSSNIPRLGGIAIMISILVTIIFYLAVFGRYTPHGIKHLELEAIMAGTLIMFFVGLLDDIKSLPCFTKLFAQIFSASIVWFMGIKIQFLANPIHYIDHAQRAAFRLDDLMSFVITVLFIVAITNAINLIDGIDGLAVGVCMIVSIASWAINLSPLLNQPAGAIFAATMAGACFAFLRYNFNPARIFLGDNGAYLLGFALACISCIGLTKKVTVVILSPILLLVFVMPLLDMFYAVFRRASNNRNWFKPDLGHLHHQLLKEGYSEKQINYFFYVITFAGGLLGTFLLGIDIGIEYLIISSVVLALWLFFSLVINAKKQK